MRDPPSIEPPHLLLVNADGTGTADLGQFPEGSHPSWSPSGDILWSEPTGLYTAPPDSLGSKVLLFRGCSRRGVVTGRIEDRIHAVHGGCWSHLGRRSERRR
jgi:hypothetical protein